MTLDIVGEHAQEDVRAHSTLQAMVDRPDMQIDGFHRTEWTTPLHFSAKKSYKIVPLRVGVNSNTTTFSSGA